jgi:hypothetical protein
MSKPIRIRMPFLFGLTVYYAPRIGLLKLDTRNGTPTLARHGD